ncbi:MAG: DUF2384 domain-containing protein [Gammaproteobacteria bacterium]
MLNIKTEERSHLTVKVMHELDSWGLKADELIQILQLPSGTPKRALRKYRENTSFPIAAELDNRLDHVIGIINALRTSFPHNHNMGSFWMKQRNKRFENKSPVAYITSEGLGGLISVRKHLDCSYMPD